jgi:hypothetical protein
MSWPGAGARSADTFAAPIEGRENHRLDVYLDGAEPADVLLDGESVWPVWFKLEWKGSGEMSAKVRGLRLSTRLGDTIAVHAGRPDPS